MALFGGKKKTEVKPKAKKAEVSTAVAHSTPSVASKLDHGFTLKRPRVTEKASMLGENQSVYVFEVSRDANKGTIKKAVIDVYKVTPIKVSIAQTPDKNVFTRGKYGVKSGVKKAYVYLKKGDKIEVM